MVDYILALAAVVIYTVLSKDAHSTKKRILLSIAIFLSVSWIANIITTPFFGSNEDLDIGQRFLLVAFGGGTGFFAFPCTALLIYVWCTERLDSKQQVSSRISYSMLMGAITGIVVGVLSILFSRSSTSALGVLFIPHLASVGALVFLILSYVIGFFNVEGRRAKYFLTATAICIVPATLIMVVSQGKHSRYWTKETVATLPSNPEEIRQSVDNYLAKNGFNKCCVFDTPYTCIQFFNPIAVNPNTPKDVLEKLVNDYPSTMHQNHSLNAMCLTNYYSYVLSPISRHPNATPQMKEVIKKGYSLFK